MPYKPQISHNAGPIVFLIIKRYLLQKFCIKDIPNNLLATKNLAHLNKPRCR
jgi:hypothetical protein